MVQSKHLSRISISFIAFLVVFFVALCVVGQNVHAQYACGTFGAGDYSAGNAGSGADCPDTTTPPAANTTPPASGSSSSTNSGTSTGTDTAPISGSQSITLNDYAAYNDGSGQAVAMKAGDKVYFTLGPDSHTITLRTISADSIIMTIASTPTDVSVQLGKTLAYDVNKDGVSDITMTYKALSASGDTATVVFAKYLAADSTAPITTQADSPRAQHYWWLLVVGIILAALVIYLVIRKSRNVKTPTA